MTDEQPPISPDEQPPTEPPPPPPSWEPPSDQSDPRQTTAGFFPLNFGRVFDLTFSMYRRGWRTLLPIAFAVEIVSAAVDLLLLPQPTALVDLSQGSDSTDIVNALSSSVLPATAGAYVAFVVVLLLGYVEFGALSAAIGHIYAGSRPSGWVALKDGLRKLAAFAVLALFIMGGALAIVLAGIFVLSASSAVLFAVGVGTSLANFFTIVVYVGIAAGVIFVVLRWSMAVPAMMFESLGARDAMRRSSKLIADSGWRVIGYYVAFYLIGFVASVVVSTIVNLALDPYTVVDLKVVAIDYSKLVVVTLIGTVVTAITAPITTIPAVLLYLDLRVRHGDPISPPGRGALVTE